MPLQSGSDRVLKLMNRNYRRDKYLKIIESLKSRVPDIAITTDIIVGFPGETEEDFQMTLEVMDLVQFDNSYSYSFSPRPGTPAATMPELLSQKEKIERLQILQRKQEQITAARLAAWVGKDVEVLVDNWNQNREGCLQGRTSQNVMLNFDTAYQGLKIGDIVAARVVAPKRFTLMGELKNHTPT
jgi:tRNA-2-methylthio-N6-dimethylallyladenosine synthase